MSNVIKSDKVKLGKDLLYHGTNQDRFKIISAELAAIYARKNSDYGNSFDISLDEDGLLVSKIRLGDKLNRFSNLLKKGTQEVGDESIRDTILDLANYAIMTVMWMDKNWKEDIPLEKGDLNNGD